ncbi:alpha/beta hydrolase [Labrenzia sp. PHM005]|uniref:alpha/beta hydrolase n=1 Tax=Labrenzia sp. PHM005 TaxID=2590016 RepID=UPI00113FF5E2|nr:alpha/beta hydrolase [Labrenzia sp. PHM005]QDG77925.1 alpha/beta hydrolase [Labrenzia sp. PHM005]
MTVLSSFSNQLLRLSTCLILLWAVAACSSRPETGALTANTQPAKGAEAHDILIATTRERDPRPGTLFNGERSITLNFAEAVVSVPPSHKPGAVEWPSAAPGNPKTDFVTRRADYIDSEQKFVSDLNRKLASLPKGKREIMLFIHGYNTHFAEGLYRYVQIVHDANSTTVPVFFTWASRGKLQNYVYDLNSAAIARDGLEKTLMLLARSNAEKISILAHSMGNYLLMETGRQMSRASHKTLNRKLDSVVMAAPDIDIDLFKATLRRLGRPPKPYIVVVSQDDSALRASRAIAGGIERLGAYSNDEELAELGAIVFNVTELETAETSNHSKFAALAQYSTELQKALLSSGLADGSSINGTTTLGDNLGSLVGNTAQSAVTLPIKIIAAPFSGQPAGL